MADANDNEIKVVESSPSVGKRLKEAREAKKFTVAEVAAQLRFTKEIVICLENQQWEKLHGRTYTRGYFTSYVKFLGLPHDEMLAAFNIEYTIHEPSPSLMQHSVPVSKPFPWLPVILVIVVAVIAWFAYQQWQSTLTTDNGQTPTQQTEPSSSATDDPFDSSVVEPLESEPQNQSQNMPSEPSGLNEQQVATMETDSVVAEDEWADYNQIEQQQPLEAAEQSMVSAPDSVLELAFNAKCWVEVKDASAKILVNKIMEADQHLKLSSSQPLHILLGKASAATVRFNQRDIDLAPYIQGDIARLTLGVES